jgi:hypothetical protein
MFDISPSARRSRNAGRGLLFRRTILWLERPQFARNDTMRATLVMFVAIGIDMLCLAFALRRALRHCDGQQFRSGYGADGDADRVFTSALLC